MILLEKQCVSLELTRRLKELSVKQDGSQFYWIVDDKGNKVNIAWHKELTAFAKHGVHLSAISAFTVAELGEMLPWSGEMHVETDKSSDDKE
jgi:hypothetical protein